MPRSHEFLRNFKHHQERLFSLKQVNKRHPRVLTEDFGPRLAKSMPAMLRPLGRVVPQGGDGSGENPLLGCVGDHP